MLSASFMKMKWIRYHEPPLPANQQILFFHRLSHILEKGYPLLDALKMTGWDEKLKPIADELSTSLTNGETIDIACKKACFSPTVTNFLYFSNVQHNLPKILKQCKDLLVMKKEYKHKFMQVIRYPLILFVFLIIAFTIMKQTIMPNFIILFEGQETTALRMMVVMDHVTTFLGLSAIFLTLSLVSLKFILPRLTLQKKLSLYEKIPLVKGYHSFTVSFLFTTHLYSLLRAGLTLKPSFELMKDHREYELLSHYSEKLLQELAEGKSFGQAVHTCTLFRTELTNIFHNTNDIKALQDELEMLADFFMDYIQEKITRWMEMIQPIFFILIALVVISIYASIMLPLYQWMNQL